MTLHARAPLPPFLQKGRAETRTLTLRNEQGGALPVTGGTYTLRDADGRAVVDAAALTVSSGVPSYNLLATFADSYTLPLHPWREEWALTGLSGEAAASQTVPLEVMVCHRAPVRLCDLEQLYKLHVQWRGWVPKAQRGGDVGVYLETAWEEMLHRLLGDDVLPQRVLNWWAFSTVHKYWAASLTSRDFATDAPDATKWERLADTYEKKAEALYTHHTRVRADRNEDGVADSPGVLEETEPELFLTNVPGTYPGRSW